jgi:predicted transcriptional regulator
MVNLPIWQKVLSATYSNPKANIYRISRIIGSEYAITYHNMIELRKQKYVTLKKVGRSYNIKLTKKGEIVGESCSHIVKMQIQASSYKM